MGLETVKRRRKPRADSILNRERLLEAATEIFAAGGPQASLEAVARRAEVGIGTLYRHFPTREALFEAVWPTGSPEKLILSKLCAHGCTLRSALSRPRRA
jgi:hypothetical protein